jgi:hypothetical protein
MPLIEEIHAESAVMYGARWSLVPCGRSNDFFSEALPGSRTLRAYEQLYWFLCALACPAGWCSHGSCFDSGCGVICGSGGVGWVVKSSAMEASER